MWLNCKGRMAVTALVDLATWEGSAPVKLQTISERQNISLSYLELLFAKLRRHRIVKSVRGPGGGYYLGGAGQDITIAKIIAAVDGSHDTNRPGARNSPRKGQPRCVDELWGDLNDVLYDHLTGVTLEHLVDKHQRDKLVTRPRAHAGRARRVVESTVSASA